MEVPGQHRPSVLEAARKSGCDGGVKKSVEELSITKGKK
jgi:hypothetical protein